MLTDLGPLAAAGKLRRERLHVSHPRVEPEVELRCLLADYGAALGLNSDSADGQAARCPGQAGRP